LARGGITAVLPAAARGSRSRASASNAPRLRRGKLIGDQRIGRHLGQKVVCSDKVVRFTAGQEKAERITERVDQCMDLGAQSAARAPDRLVLAGFFLAPALC
jgi:hypothetical protein